MSEKPILFSTPMVQAILARRKTMTRRVIKPQPTKNYPLGFISSSTDSAREGQYAWGTDENGGVLDLAKPRYQIGDILWVRETWRRSVAGGFFIYKVDDGREERNKKLAEIDPTLHWKSSIYMPRAAARLFLKVKNVRVERLQDITAEDAIAEGIKINCKHDDYVCSAYPCDFKTTFARKDHFKNMWDSINAKRGLGWDINPWCWVLEFEVIPNGQKN
ncbi:hypothetical protein [Desulfosporosinus sp. SB140]|uniref:hypothetical protein n=1 Tax=Desulfosporosinus paludis TaxID=3115649 RepID=UPI0038903F5F